MCNNISPIHVQGLWQNSHRLLFFYVGEIKVGISRRLFFLDIFPDLSSLEYTTTEVLAEVAYVLTGFYGETRENVAVSITKLLIDVHIEHKEAVMEAIRLYHDTSLDFVDCVLIGRNHVLGDDVFSFDKKLNKRLVSS